MDNETRILTIIKNFKEKHGHYPSQSELARYMGLTRSRIYQIVGELKKNGSIKVVPTRREAFKKYYKHAKELHPNEV